MDAADVGDRSSGVEESVLVSTFVSSTLLTADI